MNRLLVIALLCFASGSVNAGAMYGYGTKSCGGFLAARAENKAIAVDFETWVTGFLSAYNWTQTDASANIIAGTDMDGVMYWLENYCHKNPTELFGLAIGVFVIERAANSK